MVISVLLAVFCTGIFVWTKDRHEFGYLLMTVAIDDEHNLLVDEKDDYYYLLYTENNRIKKGIKYKIIDNGYFNLPQNIYIDGDEIYLQNFYNEVGYMETNMEFYRLDMSSRSMVKVEEYSEDDVNSALADVEKNEIYVCDNFYVRDGKVVHLIETFSYDDERYRVYTAELQGGKLVFADEPLVWDEPVSEIYPAGESCLGLTEYGLITMGDDSVYDIGDEYYALYHLGNGSYAGRNITTGEIDRIDTGKASVTVYDDGLLEKLEERSADVTDVRAMGAYGDRTILSVYDENGASLLEYKNGHLSSRSVIWHMNFLTRLIVLLMFLVLSMITIAFVNLFFVKLMRKFIMVRIAVILVAALLLCDCVVYTSIKNVMNSEDLESLEQSLEQKAWQYDSMELVTDIYDFHDKAAKQVTDFRSELLNIQQDVAISDLLNITTEYYGLDRADGSLLCISDFKRENRIEQLGFAINSAANEMLETGNVVFCNTYDKLGEDIEYLLYPTLDAAGEINGCYLIDASRPEAEYETEKFMKYIISDVLIINIALAVLCLGLTWVLLFPLSGLRKKAEGMLNGESGEEDERPGRQKKYLNEIDLIIAHFAEMADTVAENMSEIGRLRESNQIYFQNRILESLGKQSITQVNFSEKVTETFYTISVRLPEYYDSFDNFEKLIRDLLVQLKLYQGFIGDIYGNRMLICSKQQDLENVMFFLGRENPEIQAVFDKASVQIAVIGEGDRYSFSVTLTERDRKQVLDRYHDLLNGFLLATGRAVRDERSTALCCVGSLENGEYVYEINMDNRNRKKLIRRLMHKAVELYSGGDFRQARFLFARVLMKYPGNAAAAYYIRSIESERLRMEKEGM